MSHHIEFIEVPGWKLSPAPISQGAVAGNLIYAAGQVAFDDDNNVVGEGDIRRQTEVTIERVKAVLAEAGASLTDIMYANVYLTDVSNFAAFNEVWTEEFGDHRPARALVEAKLAIDELLVEIQVVAMKAG